MRPEPALAPGARQLPVSEHRVAPALLQRMGASDDVAAVLGAPLSPNAQYPVSAYP